jgi:hypothetical protein
VKRHLVPSLLLALAVSGCSMIHVGGLKNPLGGAEPTAKGGEPSASSSSTATTTDATSATDAPKGKPAPLGDVVHKLPGFTAEDAYSLTKLAAAFKLVTPDLVRYIPSAETYSTWAPTPYDTGIFFASVPFRKFGEKECNAGGFRIQPGYQRELEEGLCAPKAAFEHLAVGTPVVLWAVGDSESIVVTLDGGRYEVSRPEELPAHPTKDAAAPPLQHTFLGQAEIGRLSRIDPAVKPTADATDATREEYVKCNLTIFDKQEKEITATLAASHALTSAQQDAKVSAIGDRYRKQQEQSCDKHLKKLEGTLKTFIDARSAARRKLWDDTATLRATLAKAP